MTTALLVAVLALWLWCVGYVITRFASWVAGLGLVVGVAVLTAAPRAFALDYPPCPVPSASEPAGSCVYLLLPSAFQLDAEDGFILGAAILGVWAAAFAIRAAIRALGSADRSDEV